MSIVTYTKHIGSQLPTKASGHPALPLKVLPLGNFSVKKKLSILFYMINNDYDGFHSNRYMTINILASNFCIAEST